MQTFEPLLTSKSRNSTDFTISSDNVTTFLSARTIQGVHPKHTSIFRVSKRHESFEMSEAGWVASTFDRCRRTYDQGGNDQSQ